MKTVICWLALLALGAYEVDAQGGRGGGRRGGSRGGRRNEEFRRFGLSSNNSLEAFNVSVWNRTVGTEEVTQTGLSNFAELKVFVVNLDRRLNDVGLDRSTVFYDYSTDPSTLALKTRRACYVMDTTPGQTYAGISADVQNRNGTVVSKPLTEVTLNATGLPLSTETIAALTAASPAVARFCQNLTIYDTTAADPATFPEPDTLTAGQRIISSLTLDSQVSILTEQEPAGRGRPGQVGGGRGRPGSRA